MRTVQQARDKQQAAGPTAFEREVPTDEQTRVTAKCGLVRIWILVAGCCGMGQSREGWWAVPSLNLSL